MPGLFIEAVIFDDLEFPGKSTCLLRRDPQSVRGLRDAAAGEQKTEAKSRNYAEGMLRAWRTECGKDRSCGVTHSFTIKLRIAIPQQIGLPHLLEAL